jgi:hypothetical protein
MASGLLDHRDPLSEVKRRASGAASDLASFTGSPRTTHDSIHDCEKEEKIFAKLVRTTGSQKFVNLHLTLHPLRPCFLLSLLTKHLLKSRANIIEHVTRLHRPLAPLEG